MKDLIAFTEISSAFTDITGEARDFVRDNIADTFEIGDSIYLGLYKPFNALYFELAHSSSGCQFFYSTASGFSPLEVEDDTRELSRSGFVTWERNINDWEESDVNGESLFWVRVQFTQQVVADFKGINIVFSDDHSMAIKNPFVMDYLPKNDLSFIRYHVAARDEIVQILRNGGYIKMPGKSEDLFFGDQLLRKDITKWDLLDFQQIKEAATFRALANIFFNESRNVDDKEYSLYRQYQGMFGQSFKLFYLSLDKDDDGIEDNSERLANNEITVVYE